MKKILAMFCGIFILFAFVQRPIFAAGIIGTNAYAWGENLGWINFKAVNGNVTVNETALSGYVWSSNYGWINLAPSNGGVTNNCSGVLGGKAWSSHLGWIDFTGATINSSGKFIGAIGTSGTDVGRINFDCANCGVYTDWTGCITPTLTPTPTSITSSGSSSSTSSSGGWAAPECTATKPSSSPSIVNIASGNNSATLTWTKGGNLLTKYLVAYGTPTGSIQYGNPNVGDADTTSYTVNGLSGGTTYYFKIKAINDCMPGDWSNEVSSTPSGGVISIPAENFTIAESIPDQLFDIALIIDNSKITKGSDLKARVTFLSFGNEETPVEMIFTIIDENGNEYYRSTDNTSIQTEGVFNKDFGDLVLEVGNYYLVMNTLYNKNVKDEFKQAFEITTETTVCASFGCNCNLNILIVLPEIIIIIYLLWTLKHKKHGRKNLRRL